MRVPVYYTVLGVDRKASDDDIRRAYRRLAAANWSGINRDRALATRRLRTLKEAYAVLGDPVRRAVYDAKISAGAAQASQPADVASPAPIALEAGLAAAPPATRTSPPALERGRHRYLRRSMIPAILLALVVIGAAEALYRTQVAQPTGRVARRVAAIAGPATHAAVPTAGRRVTAEVTHPSSAARRSRHLLVAGARVGKGPIHAGTRTPRGLPTSRPTALLPPHSRAAITPPRRLPAPPTAGGLKQRARHSGQTPRVRQHVVAPRHDAPRPLVAQAFPPSSGFPDRSVPQLLKRRGVMRPSLALASGLRGARGDRGGVPIGSGWGMRPVIRAGGNRNMECDTQGPYTCKGGLSGVTVRENGHASPQGMDRRPWREGATSVGRLAEGGGSEHPER